MRKTVLAFIVITAPIMAQVSNPSIISVSGAPSGACTAGLPNQQVLTTGVQYSCQNGIWGVVVGGSTSVTVTSSLYNASGFIAQTSVSTNTSSGATVIPVASTVGFSVGHVVIVANGGTSNQKDFAGFISAVGAGSITLSATAVSGNLLPPTAVGGTSGITANITAGWLVYEVGTTTLSAGASIGATQITMTNAASYSTGQGILIFGAGTGGFNGSSLVTKITAVSGNTLTIADAIGVGVSSGAAVQHDDTAAFQAALNLGTLNSSVKIAVPDGYYQINGAVDGTTNSILKLPNLDYYPNCCTAGSSKWFPQATIELAGNQPAPQMQSYLSATTQPHVNGAIIKSSVGGTKSVLGAFNGSATTYNNYTNILLIIRNLTFRTYPNPQATAINVGKTESLQLYDFDIDTGDTGPTTQPTNSGIYGVLGPGAQNGGNNVIARGEIMGHYWGADPGEHTRIEHVRFDNDFFPIVAGISTYGITAEDIEFVGDPHGLGVLGSPTIRNIEISQMNIEHQTSPAWVSPVDDISDASNQFRGLVSIDVQSGQTVTIANASNLNVVNMRNSPTFPYPTETFSALSNSHYASAGAGMAVYLSDGTAGGTTCSGGGNGTWAYRINGAWVCPSLATGFTPPVFANWSTLGTGCTNTASTGLGGGAAISVVGQASTTNTCGMSIAASGTFTKTMVITGTVPINSFSGILLGFTDGTKYEACGIAFNGGVFTTAISSATLGGTVGAANGATANGYGISGPAYYFRLRSVSGTSLACDYSPDQGVNWITLFNDTTPFLTVSSVFFGANSRGSTVAQSGWLVSYQ